MPPSGGFSVLDATGAVKTTTQQSSGLADPVTIAHGGTGQITAAAAFAALSPQQRVVSAATLIAANDSIVVSKRLEIAAGIQLEIASTAVLEITGPAVPESGWFDLSVENFGADTINLSTLGTVDWLALIATTNPIISSSLHSKLGAGWLANDFRWMPTNGGTLATFASNVTRTTSASDDTANNGILSASTTAVDVSANANGIGWALKVPVLATRQVLRIYAGFFTCDGQLTIAFRSGIVPSKTYLARNTDNASASRSELYKIAYFGMPGDELIITYTGQNKSATTPNVTFIGAYIATT